MNVATIIPAYNCESTIERTLESVFAQKYLPNEIIVIDDGSTDSTAEICQRFGNKICYVYQDNSGVAAARNKGINVANSEWIAFLDSDDVWLPERLLLQVDIVRRNENLSWCSGIYQRLRPCADGKYQDSGVSIPPQDRFKIKDGVFVALELLASSTVVWTGTILARKEAVLKVGGFAEDLKTGEDADLWMRLALQYPHLGFPSSPIASYTLDQPNSLTGQNARKIDNSQFIHYHRILRLANEVEDENQSRLLENIIRKKVNGYASSLLFAGRTIAARTYCCELAKQNLPMPMLKYRLASYCPEALARKAFGIRMLLKKKR